MGERKQIKAEIVFKTLAEREYSLHFPSPIASGSFSLVYKARNLASEEVAVKCVRRDGEESIKKFEKEIKALTKVQGHPNIVRLLDVFHDKFHSYIVMEWCERGNLNDHISQCGALSETLAQNIFSQLVRGVLHCHSCGVLNQDIKNENILLTDNFTVKLADFGLCILTEGADVSTQMSTCGCGSHVFAAPEVYGASLNNIPFYPALAESWAIGVVLHSMLAGQLPFKIKHYRRTWLRYVPPRNASDVCKKILYSLLCHTPSSRASVETLGLHFWVLPDVSAENIDCDVADRPSNFVFERIPFGDPSTACVSEVGCIVPKKSSATASVSY